MSRRADTCVLTCLPEATLDVRQGRVQLQAEEHLNFVQWWNEFKNFWQEQKQEEARLGLEGKDCLMTAEVGLQELEQCFVE